MPERICKTAFDYPPGTKHEPGDPIDIHEDHLRVLTAAGFIEPEPIVGTLHVPEKKPRKAARH